MSRRSDEVKRWRRWILDIEGDAYEKSALHVLVQYADENGECWPSLGRIAREAGMSERKARAIVRSLEDVGHIQVLRSKGRRTNIYLLTPAPLKDSEFDAGNPAQRAGFENPNPARQVPQPGTTGIPTRHSVPPIGKERVVTGSTPRENWPIDPESNFGTVLRVVEGGQ
tara:strand:+ start:882 stop:1388 length:507 start_codon:yes stop_codon:yes gene_type:complete